MARRKKQSATATVDAEADDLAISPIFDLGNAEFSYVTIYRDEPDDGHQGRLPPTASEVDIKRKFGGGTYTITARNTQGKPLKGGFRQLTIAGDPIFQSQAAERKWKRQQGYEEGKPAAAATSGPMTIGETLLMLEKMGEKARAESRDWAEQRSRESQLTHERNMEILRADAARRESELKFERERLERESQERIERMEREAKEERERNREFMKTTLDMMSTKAASKGGGDDAVATLLKGIELARSFGGGGGGGEEGESDPLAALATAAPQIMAEARRLIASDKPAAAAPQANPAAGGDDPNAVTLEGEIGKKARRLIMHLQGQGKDPERVLSQSIDVLMRTRAAPAAAMSPKVGRARRPGKPAAARAAAPRRPTSAAAKSPRTTKSATPKR